MAFMKTSVAVSPPKAIGDPIEKDPAPGTLRTATVNGEQINEIWDGVRWIPEAEWKAGRKQG